MTPITSAAGTAHAVLTRADLTRVDLIRGLRDYADWLEQAGPGPVPAVNASYRVPGRDYKEKLARLSALAVHLGTGITEDGMGSLVVRRWFGPLVAAGAVSHPDGSTSGYLARAAAFRAMQAGTGAAA